MLINAKISEIIYTHGWLLESENPIKGDVPYNVSSTALGHT